MALDGGARPRRIRAPTAGRLKLYGLGIDITERRRAVEALQEADRRKDEFLATLAHELRNPLAPISSGLHILRSASDESQRSIALEIMERQVDQMVRLVDDLLDVARITTGKVEMRREPIDLAAGDQRRRRNQRAAARRPGSRCHESRRRQPVFVNADRTRLAQVFANLLNNSAQVQRAGPADLDHVRPRGRATRWCASRDAGMGIHPEMLPRVFDMFRQADRTGGRSRGGLGIGLSLVKRIVEMHGGTVTAHSEGLGLGSEFVVRIPAIDGARAADAAGGPAAANGATPRRKILVVDDNEDAAESLAALLSISGHETRMAHDGPEALAAGGALPSRHRVPRHRHADARRSRNREADSPAAMGQGHGAGGADRMGTDTKIAGDRRTRASTITWSSPPIRRWSRNCCRRSRR